MEASTVGGLAPTGQRRRSSVTGARKRMASSANFCPESATLFTGKTDSVIRSRLNRGTFAVNMADSP
jgi:hypothetical protein